MPDNAPLLQIIFYANPDGYPPIINCVRSLAEGGWKVDILCRDDPTFESASYPASVSVRRLSARGDSRWLEYIDFIQRALRLARRDADLVAGHDMHGLLPATLFARWRRIPLIYHCHDFTEPERQLPLGSAIVKRFEGPCARTAALTIVPDAGRANVVKAQLELSDMPLVIPNSPRRISVSVRPCLREELRRRGAEYSKIVLRQGRIGPGHGIEMTVRSIPLWKDPNWGFVVVGPADQQFVSRMQRLSQELGVGRQFTVLPPISYETISSYTVDADLGHALYDPININHVEMGTASNKLLEYMAAGIPCLVPDFPSFRKLIEEFRCGLMVNPSDVQAIAIAVNQALGDERLAAAMGASGKSIFHERLCYEIQGEKVRKSLERLVSVGAVPQL